MFDNKLIAPALRELAKCIREDANDGAHIGNLSKEDAEDLLDFTRALLERLVTEPKRLEQAETRRTSGFQTRWLATLPASYSLRRLSPAVGHCHIGQE
jgi:Domain of unknown function (DUF4145)